MLTLTDMIELNTKPAARAYLRSLPLKDAQKELMEVPIKKRNDMWVALAKQYKIIEDVSYEDTLKFHGKKPKDDDHEDPNAEPNWFKKMINKFFNN